jgi:hypothetical protein
MRTDSDRWREIESIYVNTASDDLSRTHSLLYLCVSPKLY